MTESSERFKQVTWNAFYNSELQEWARDFQDAFPEWLDEGYDGQG